MDQFHAMFLSLISVLLFSIFWYKITTHMKPLAPPLPPGPWGLPIVGYLPFLRSNLLQQFTELAHQYGPIFSFRLGNRLNVVITSPSLIKQVVRDHDAIFSNRDVPIVAQVITFGGNDIAWSPNNSTWRSLRKLFVREMLSNSSLESSSGLRRDEIIKGIINVYRETGKPIEIADMSYAIAVNVIMSMLWGGTVTGEEGERVGSEFRRLLPKLVSLMGKPNVSDIFPILARLDIQGVKKQAQIAMRSFDQIFDLVIDQKLEKLRGGEDKVDGKEDFLQILVQKMENEDSETSITRLQLKAILMDIVAGGVDTTSTSIEWVMAELMKNPEAMEKVQQELSNVVGTNNVVEEFQLPKLEYLMAVFKETLRLHPVAPLLLPKCPSQTTVIGGYTIPKQARVFINIWAIQRDPSIWYNPLEFKPERFLNDGKRFDLSGNDFYYMPFGSGRRICAGVPMAERMSIYMLASLLHSFKWKLLDGENLDMEEKLGISLKKKEPLIAVPYPRLTNLNLYHSSPCFLF